MVRSGVALSTSLALLLLLPAGSGAQVEEGAGPRTHTVESGETLGSIAVSYYGDASEWSRIFRANGDRIQDPDRLAPGTELVIPRAQRRVVTRIEVRSGGRTGDEEARLGGSADEAALQRLRRRQELARYSRFEPTEATDFRGERTVFYQDPALNRNRGLVQGAGTDELPAVAAAMHRTSGWLLLPGEELGALGMIPSFAGDQDVQVSRISIQHRDLVQGDFHDGVAPEEGDAYLVVRIDREIDGVGRVILPTGRVVVRRVDGGGAVLDVVEPYGRIALGQRLVADRSFTLQDRASEPAGEAIEARIVAFERERELQLRNDLAFLDVGRSDGVRPGDEFVVVLGEEDGWRGRVSGRLQVLDVRERTSTARLLRTTSREIRPGLTVRLDRRAP